MSRIPMPTDFDKVEIDPLPEGEADTHFGMVLRRGEDYVAFLVSKDVTAEAIEHYYDNARWSLSPVLRCTVCDEANFVAYPSHTSKACPKCGSDEHLVLVRRLFGEKDNLPERQAVPV